MTFFPYSVFDAPWLAPMALLLDLLLGDPRLPWRHPVIFVGKLLAFLEKPCRILLGRFPHHEAVLGRLLGGLALLGALLLVGLLTRLFLAIPLLNALLALYLAWAGLAMGCLLETGSFVLTQIEEATPPKARQALSMLVSRETRFMDCALMRKTLADTMTENFTDALTAPFFWLLIAGPVGLWLYKTCSTADSMWGYLTPKWRYLGYAAARSDDILAFLPARLSVLAVAFSDAVIRLFFPQKRLWKGSLPSLPHFHHQAWGMPSPNSGFSMAVFAWLMQAQMAGPSVYFGERVEKPFLGPKKEDAHPWDRNLLQTLFFLMKISSWLGMFFLWILLLGIHLLISGV